MQPTTRAMRVRVDADRAAPAVTPVYRTSAFSASSPFFYSRKDNPNTAELEETVATLEGAEHAVSVSSGMSAIYMLLDQLRPGDIVVLSTLVYGCTFRLFSDLQAVRGYELVCLDLTDPKATGKIPRGTAMVFFETPTNPFLRTIDIRRVASEARACNPTCIVVVDNTWATPLFQQPLRLGADVSLHSGTKYFSGHSDAMNGVLLTDRSDLFEAFMRTRFYGGMVLSPDTAWLVRRSLQTLEIRLQRHQASAHEVCEFLSGRPEVAQVYFPTIDGIQLKGYACILFFRLQPSLAGQFGVFADSLNLFSTGTAMAAVTSTVAQPYSGSHASMSEDEKAAIGLGPDLVRLCIGLENVEDLKADLAFAFEMVWGLASVDATSSVPG